MEFLLEIYNDPMGYQGLVWGCSLVLIGEILVLCAAGALDNFFCGFVAIVELFMKGFKFVFRWISSICKSTLEKEAP